MKKILYIFLAAAALMLAAMPACAQRVSVKTNMAYWAACTPDFGMEFVTGEHSSISFSAFGHYKPYGVWDSKLFAIQPEYRYWFNGRPLTREYIGVIAGYATYDTNIAKMVYRGDAVSLGISGGYVFSLGKRWAFELGAGVGLLGFKQKQYAEGDDYDEFFNKASKPNAWGYKLFPSKLSATIIYMIK